MNALLQPPAQNDSPRGGAIAPPPATVRSRMSAPAITVRADARSDEIDRLLDVHAISALPVVDAEGKLVGIVATTDLLASPVGSTLRASELMSSPVIVARPDEILEEAAWRMVAGRVHRLVVVDREDRVLGVLSSRDVLEEVMSRRIEDPIRTVMSTPVESIAIGDTIDEALVRLRSANVHGLVVVDGTAPVGVFTQAEALTSRRLSPSLRASTPVEEVMSYETLCLDASTPVRRAAAYAVAMNARRILVVESKHLVGILSCIDLVGVLARAPAEA
jgi:CBS domain-containing protein